MLKVLVGIVLFLGLFYGGMYLFAYGDYGSAGAAKVAGIAVGAFVGAMILIPTAIRLFGPKF